MINIDRLRTVLKKALEGDAHSREVVKLALTPDKTDTVESIEQKIRIFISVFFGASKTYDDADYHREIDRTFAEQIHSYLNHGVPHYHMIMPIGFRESGKTTRVKMNQAFLTAYLYDIIDLINISADDIGSSAQFTMDLFNMFHLSNIGKWYSLIDPSVRLASKKESQTMTKFTTKNGVTFTASGARKSRRGNVQTDITEHGEIETKRPKVNIFDDIENENTIRSMAATQQIRGVMQSSIDGKDQLVGYDILLGNYLSLRGNVAYFVDKSDRDPRVKIIMIPIYDRSGAITWPGKYVMTDVEQSQLAHQGIMRVSIESKKRNSDNFDTEFLNNPKRSRVYFSDDVLRHVREDDLVSETARNSDGLLTIEHPTKYDKYAIGVDTAKGLGKDQSAFVVYKITGLIYEEVANFRDNKIPPEQFAPYTVNIAERYNYAQIFPERNFPGNEFIAYAKPLYNHIFQYEDEQLGIPTNMKTKPEMFSKYKKMLLDGLLRIRSEYLYRQLMEYPSELITYITQDDQGGHFDLLMAGVVGLFRLDQAVAVADSRLDDRLKSSNEKLFTTSIDSIY